MKFGQPRQHAVFGPGEPRFTPGDRLDALHMVAIAARAFRDAPADPDLDDTWKLLVRALDRLEEIERYQGVDHPAVNARAEAPGRAS